MGNESYRRAVLLKEISDFKPLTNEEIIFHEYQHEYKTGKLSREEMLDFVFDHANDADIESCIALIVNMPELAHEMIERWPDLPKERVFGDALVFPDTQDVLIKRIYRYSPILTHSHDGFLEILCVLDGTCSIHFEDDVQVLKSGVLAILPPNVSHSVLIDDPDGIVFFIKVRNSSFATSFFDLLSENYMLSAFFNSIAYNVKMDTIICIETGETSDITGIILDMYRQSSLRPKYYRSIMNSYLSLLFSTLMSYHEDKALLFNCTSIADSGKQNSLDILEYISKNLRDISLSSLAEKFGYSETYISKYIKNTTGKSFSKIVQEIRLTQAISLMRNPYISINNIIESVGYCDISNFYKLFKQKYGISPQQYRSQLIG